MGDSTLKLAKAIYQQNKYVRRARFGAFKIYPNLVTDLSLRQDIGNIKPLPSAYHIWTY
jgi:hypothetical protein